jgi:uncharacterized protein (DUF4415 family)
MTKESITTVSMDEIDQLEDQTRMDAPEGPELGPNFWANAKVVYPDGPKERLTVRFDRDVVTWFKAGGRGYQTRMNAVLRSYFEAQEKNKPSP